jgi:hypothetical protein
MSGVRPGSGRWQELKAAIVSNDERNWRLGDAALEIAPIGEDSAHNGNYARLQQWLDELAAERGVVVKFTSLRQYRQIADAWPPVTRVTGASHKAHQILMAEDKHHLLRPGMTTTQASEAAGHATRARRPVGRKKAGRWTPETLATAADRVIEELADAEVADEVKRQAVERKVSRRAQAALHAAEREVEAAQLAQEKREAEAERERLRRVEVGRGQVVTAIKSYDTLIRELRAGRDIVTTYLRLLDDLPMSEATARTLDRELDEWRHVLAAVDKRLHPERVDGREAVPRGVVIDARVV